LATTDSAHAVVRSIPSTARRFVLAVALLPIVPCVSIIGVVAISDYAPMLLSRTPNAPRGFANIDELRWFHIIFAVIWVMMGSPSGPCPAVVFSKTKSSVSDSFR
jgi:hypothetical protein